MMGYGKCLVCKCENPYEGSNEAQRAGWYKLVMRSGDYKYSGIVCPECAWNTIRPLYMTDGRTWHIAENNIKED